MPTARELLEQADALMRRNRRRGKDKRGPSTLTDVLVDRSAILAPTVILPDAVRTEADPLVVAANADVSDPIALDTLSDVPVLTDVVDVWPEGQAPRVVPTEVLPPQSGLDDALEADALGAIEEDVGHGAADRARGALEERQPVAAPTADTSSSAFEANTQHGADAARDDAVASAPPSERHGAEAAAGRAADHAVDGDGSARTSSVAPPLDDDFILEIPPLDATAEHSRERVEAAPVQGAAHVVAVEVRRGTPDWDAMAEEIRMQVLQRLDLLTDAGMRDRLGERLRPIVDRASAELVETINQELGELVRNCVAEAIEREIESWKKRET